MTKQCSNCYYYDVCNSSDLCDDYAPLGDAAEDYAIEELIEKGRQEFRAEWEQYISEYND